MDRAPVPELGTEPIPADRYTSADYAGREWEHMWQRVWLVAGRESDAAQPGDYFTFEIGPESLLIIRQRDGSLAARHNVCMHRGNRLRDPGCGHAQRFSCKFHGWTYGIDGSLERALDPESFPQGTPNERLQLAPVRCDTWGGFVFVNLDGEAEPLQEYLGVIPEHLGPYHLDEATLVQDITIEIACNWKTSLDAFNESYHLSATHPATLEFSDDVHCRIDCYDRHSRMLLPLAQASPRHAGHGTVTPLIKAYFVAGAGIDPQTFEGDASQVRAAIAKSIVERRGPSIGVDYSDLNEDQLNDDFHYTLFPNITFNAHAQFVWVFRHRPHPSDPQRMFFDFWNLVRSGNQGLVRGEHSHHVATPEFSLAKEGLPGGDLLDEDLFNLPRVQQGMNSAAFRGLHLGDQEIRIRHFHHNLDRYLERGDG
jgi:phenylpropionate dioxygenase-like ring-hydroxylating dioxygenase large terminal subunit